MNIVLKKNHPVEYFIACIKKNNGSYVVCGRYITESGKMREQSKSKPYERYEDAQSRCRNLAKMKVRKKDFVEMPVAEIPANVSKFVEVPEDMQITPGEMLIHIQKIRNERYVVFNNVLGLEEYFDAGVEYLASKSDGDGFMLVYDRFGEPRHVFEDRFDSVTATEDAKEAAGINRL